METTVSFMIYWESILIVHLTRDYILYGIRISVKPKLFARTLALYQLPVVLESEPANKLKILGGGGGGGGGGEHCKLLPIVLL